MTSYGSDVTNVLGHQHPRILHSPVSLGLSTGSAGREAVELAALAGLDLDPWQQLVLEHGLATRSDGLWAAREVGLVVSRQNGKGSILEALELASLFLLDEKVCVHSAHVLDTSMEAFNRIMTLIEQTPDLEQYVTRVIRSHGDEGVEVFREGKKRRLRFKTRTKGGGRGLSGDRMIIDEAMYYNATHDAALRPIVSAMPNPQLWFTGSAGDKESTVFGRLRANGIKGKSKRLAFMEWSIDPCTEFCPPDCDEHDRSEIPGEFDMPEEELEIAKAELVASYAKANPGLGIRITVETCESERLSMDPEKFKCERLGVGDWPVEGEAWRVIDKDAWMNRYDPVSSAVRPYCFALDVTPDRKFACIAVAGGNGEGMVHAEITAEDTPSGPKLDHRPGVKWVVPRVTTLCKKYKAPVVIDKGSQAGAFIDELEAAGVKVLTLTTREYAQACGQLYSAVIPRGGAEPTFVHKDQAPLTVAVAGAEKRELADLWAWDKRNSTVDISPLVAVTNATWGHLKGVHTKRPKPMVAWG